MGYGGLGYKLSRMHGGVITEVITKTEKRDEDGNIIYDENGKPEYEPNENYLNLQNEEIIDKTIDRFDRGELGLKKTKRYLDRLLDHENNFLKINNENQLLISESLMKATKEGKIKKSDKLIEKLDKYGEDSNTTLNNIELINKYQQELSKIPKAKQYQQNISESLTKYQQPIKDKIQDLENENLGLINDINTTENKLVSLDRDWVNGIMYLAKVDDKEHPIKTKWKEDFRGGEKRLIELKNKLKNNKYLIQTLQRKVLSGIPETPILFDNIIDNKILNNNDYNGLVTKLHNIVNHNRHINKLPFKILYTKSGTDMENYLGNNKNLLPDNINNNFIQTENINPSGTQMTAGDLKNFLVDFIGNKTVIELKSKSTIDMTTNNNEFKKLWKDTKDLYKNNMYEFIKDMGYDNCIGLTVNKITGTESGLHPYFTGNIGNLKLHHIEKYSKNPTKFIYKNNSILNKDYIVLFITKFGVYKYNLLKDNLFVTYFSKKDEERARNGLPFRIRLNLPIDTSVSQPEYYLPPFMLEEI